VLGQGTIDLVVTWHRLFLAGSRILVNVVASTVTQENAALLFDLADQLATLHSTISFVL